MIYYLVQADYNKWFLHQIHLIILLYVIENHVLIIHLLNLKDFYDSLFNYHY